MGQVVSFKLSRGRVESLVQGSRPKPYKVTIEVKPHPEGEVERASPPSMASKAVFASKLLAGEMPVERRGSVLALVRDPLPRQEGDKDGLLLPGLRQPVQAHSRGRTTSWRRSSTGTPS